MRNNHNLSVDLVKGAIAGAAATWVMERVTTWMYEHESAEAQERENRARQGGTAYAAAAEKTSSC